MAKLLLCVSGGIAAYKAIDLARILYKGGHEVRCVLTANASKFVSPLSFEVVTANTVECELFGNKDRIVHISLADWADIIVVAPATANIMAKAVQGIADDLLSTLLLAHTRPVLYVPAMNVHMYESIPTQENIKILKQRGHHLLEPATGLLACGYEGKGKFPPNSEIVYAISTYLENGEDLKGIKVLLTAGATVEAIDPMRYISNHSSGKMGMALARALALRGAEVCLVYGKVSEEIPYYLREAIRTLSASEMESEVMKRFAEYDWIIKCAAVADYQPEHYQAEKLPKSAQLQLSLVATPDILKQLGARKKPRQKLIGFAACSGDPIPGAINKIKSKNLDLICANSTEVVGKDDTEISLIGKMKLGEALKTAPEFNAIHISGDKFHAAHRIINAIKSL